MNSLRDIISTLKEYNSISKKLDSEGYKANITGLSESQKAHFSYALLDNKDSKKDSKKDDGAKGVYVACNELAARKAYSDFSFFFGEDALLLPYREYMLYDIEARSNEVIHKRAEAIARILDGNYKLLVVSIETLSQLYPQKDVFESKLLTVKKEEQCDISELVYKLTLMGYERESLVEGKGQFSVRGGIIDVFPINMLNPCRMEFFGDEIDSIRIFEADTQRSVDYIDELKIIPAHDSIYDESYVVQAISEIESDMKKILSVTKDKGLSEKIKATFSRYIERVNEKEYLHAIDKLLPYIYENRCSLSDYFSNKTIFFFDDIPRMRLRIETLIKEHTEHCEQLLQKGQILPKTFELFFELEDLLHHLSKCRSIYYSNVTRFADKYEKTEEFSINGVSINPYGGRMDIMLKEIKEWISENYRVLLLVASSERGKHLNKY